MEDLEGKSAMSLLRNRAVIATIALLVVVAAAFLLWSHLFGYSSPQAPAATSTGPEVITLRLGHNIIEDSGMHAAALRFAQEVESRSNGRLRVSVHPKEQLGNDLQMLELAKDGKLDMVLTPTAKLSSAVPAMQYADLPFYFSSPDELYAMLDGEPGGMLLGQLKSIGLVGVTFWGNGFKHFTATRPLHTPDDFRKLRFRVMKSRLIMEQFDALDAASVPIEFQEIYQAVADGVVDGQENPLVAIVGMNLHKVQPHLTLSSHGYLAYAFSISAKVFERLSPADRELLLSVGRELTQWQREETRRRDAVFLEQVRAAGVTVYELTAEQRAAFSKALTRVTKKFEPVIGADILAKTEELRWGALPAEQRAKFLVLGLDADLSLGDGAEVGIAIRRGMELAVDEINARGGLLGKQLRVVARDHRSIPGEGVKSLQAFSAMPETLAVVGGKHSSVIAEEIGLIHERPMPYLVPWAAASNVTDNGHQPNFVFRLSVRDQDVAPFLMDKASNGGRKVALLLEQSGWGRSNEEAVKQWVSRGGSAPVATHWFNRGDKDFSAVLTEIERSGAQALMVVSNSVEATLIANALAQRPVPLPVYSHWGVIGQDFQANALEALDKVQWHTVSTVPVNPPSALSAPALRLLGLYRKAYGIAADTPLPAFMGAAHAYDLVNLLASATRRAGSADPKAVQAALEKLSNQPGVVRSYRQPFTPQRHDALDRSDLKLVRFDQKAQLVRVD